MAKATTVLKSNEDLGLKITWGLLNIKCTDQGLFLVFGWSEGRTLLLGCLGNKNLTESLWQVNCPQRRRKGSSAFLPALDASDSHGPAQHYPVRSSKGDMKLLHGGF